MLFIQFKLYSKLLLKKKNKCIRGSATPPHTVTNQIIYNSNRSGRLQVALYCFKWEIWMHHALPQLKRQSSTTVKILSFTLLTFSTVRVSNTTNEYRRSDLMRFKVVDNLPFHSMPERLALSAQYFTNSLLFINITHNHLSPSVSLISPHCVAKGERRCKKYIKSVKLAKQFSSIWYLFECHISVYKQNVWI